MSHSRHIVNPVVVPSSLDAWLPGIPYHHTLAVCFSCDCRCSARLGPPAFRDTVPRLPGLAGVVGTQSTGCGECVNICPVGAIDFHVAENADLPGWLLGRIQERTDIGHLLGGERAP
jgi:ferredoxin